MRLRWKQLQEVSIVGVDTKQKSNPPEIPQMIHFGTFVCISRSIFIR